MRTVVGFEEIDRTGLAAVGGKGASLGELWHIDGIRVPAGFCVTTDAFRRFSGEASIDDLLDRLSVLTREDHEAIRTVSAEIRRAFEKPAIPDDVVGAITSALDRLGAQAMYAVRSSATAEDLPDASFAGQHDTSLNVTGRSAILEQVRRCWASLFTERAVTYRIVNGIDHRKVRMAVVIQRMIDAEVSGVMFTADPLSGNRTVLSIEAAFGLGEELVSGHASADVFKYRGEMIVDRTIVGAQATLTDAQVERLAQQGRQIEAHFGRPQDIEWCVADDEIYVVQSRPITTLFPVPLALDGRKHVYVSTGHQQMYTAAMRPLGISVRQLTAKIPMHEAGGRLFVDITQAWMSPAARAGVLAMLGKSDPLTGDALRTLIEREDPLPPTQDVSGPASAPPPATVPAPIATDPAIVAELIANGQASNAILERDIQTKSGPALIDFILADFQELQRILFDARSSQAIMAGMEAAWWLNDTLEAWLGEKGAADVLAQSVPNNVTSEMGLDLLRVADVIRPHPDVVAFLERAAYDSFMNDLPTIAGGAEARDAIQRWLDRYGMRCVGEIDITRPRWVEQPSALIPLILGNVRNFEPGAGERRFEQGLAAARAKEADVLERLRALPDGEAKAIEVKAMVDRMRTFAGYREYPKYFFISRYWPYKRALMKEGERLVHAGAIAERDDIFFLTLHELRDVARTHEVDPRLIDDRKAAFRLYEGMTPPRVLTSDGEMLAGSYRRDDLPPGALVGLAVSTGIVEGRARVVFDPSQANLEPGDILVTPFTDPSWTPAFVAITGLVTEVGGLMTHGAVIAREYGLPAVVNVEHATRLIRDGQRIRVDGTNGFVELLS